MSNASKKSPKTNTKSDHSFTEKWSSEIERFGFTQIPNQLITCQGQLNLSDGELVTLIQLTKFWYRKSEKVYPAINTLASYTCKGYTTVQKRLKSLEDKGFIRRKRNNGTSSQYDLSPLAAVLYNHQKTCQICRKMSGVAYVKVNKVPYSETTYKEDESRTHKFDNNVGNFYELAASRLEGFYE